MYSVKVKAVFSSAHNLRGYKGKCEDLHGHNWQVELVAVRSKLDKIGMAADFKYLKDNLRACLERLDHKYLNRIPYFKKHNPTSEIIAKYIYDSLKTRIKGLASVSVWESGDSCATYYEK